MKVTFTMSEKKAGHICGVESCHNKQYNCEKRFFCFPRQPDKENDDTVGYAEVDKKKYSQEYENGELCNSGLPSEINDESKVPQEFTPEEQEETDLVYKFFLQLAGEDQEVDWLELKTILDYAMKAELRNSNDSNTTTKKQVKEVNAAPSTTSEVPQTQVMGENGIISNILSVLCGTLCKDTPLAEIIPAPVQTTPLNSMFCDVGLEGFSKDACRSMVSMLDTDRSGRLGYHEFKKLWLTLRNWKNSWIIYDTDRSGTFSGFELREALNCAGYRLNNRILNILMHRYGTKKGEIHFDDFMMCAIKLKTMIDIYKEKDQAESDTAVFSMEEWLECTLYS